MRGIHTKVQYRIGVVTKHYLRVSLQTKTCFGIKGHFCFNLQISLYDFCLILLRLRNNSTQMEKNDRHIFSLFV